MAEAALDYDYFEPEETLEIPEGGIADFLTAKTGSWADDEVPSSGIARVKHVVDQLAEYGRFDDEYMVHAAPNETVIPFPVLDANPKLRLALYAQMRALGLDPERYTVGNDLNSINPVTGQREFGFFKKIKKFFKKVVKVIKKIAPIVLPIALSFIPVLGPIYGAMLGSGLGSLIQGGSFKDALKAAAISGATAGIMKGIGGGFKGMRDPSSTFRAGATKALQEGFRPAATQAALQQAALSGATAPGPVAPTTADMAPGTELGGFLDEAAQQAGFQELTAAPVAPAPQGGTTQQFTARPVGATPGQQFPDLPGTPTPKTTPGGPITDPATLSLLEDIGSDPSLGALPATTATPTPTPLPEVPSFREGLKHAFTPKDDVGFLEGMGEAFFPKGPSYLDVLASQGKAGTTDATEIWLAKQIARDAGPPMMRKLLPLYGASMAAAKAADMFKGEEDPLFDPSITGADLLRENPEEYRVDINLPPPIEIQQWEGTGVGPQTTIQWAPPGGADGGDVDSYPPRIGGINGPGTGTSDDVPAMLSDGEFVFTAKAVRGAGNGSRKSGTNNLYSLMRNFEGRA